MTPHAKRLIARYLLLLSAVFILTAVTLVLAEHKKVQDYNSTVDEIRIGRDLERSIGLDLQVPSGFGGLHHKTATYVFVIVPLILAAAAFLVARSLLHGAVNPASEPGSAAAQPIEAPGSEG